MTQIVTIKGKSQKTKNRLFEHGDQWKIVQWDNPIRPVLCLFQSVQTGYLKWENEDFTFDK